MNKPIHNQSSIVQMFSLTMLARRHMQYALILLIMFTLSACGSSSEQLTITAQYALSNTQVADIRSSATVANARLQITLDHASTRVVEVEQQGLFMRSTLVALGTDSAFIANNLPVSGSFPTFTPPPTSPVNAVVTPVPLPAVTEELNAEGTLVLVTPPPSDDNTQARLENIVLASGVNNNDCAIDSNPLFTPNSTEIYVVATAFNIPAGATISSIWQSNGTEVALFSFTPANPINGDCIWFFIDQTDTVFIPGTWSVELTINDISAAPPVPFQITES